MKRGEIYFAHLDPTMGSEINKKRPVVIISNDANNRAAETLTVLPITSNVEKIYPFEVGLEVNESNLPKKSKVQCQQIRTLSKKRFDRSLIAKLSEANIVKIEKALRLHLSI